MKKWPLVIFLGIAFGFSCFVFWMAERPEPIECLPDTFEAEVDYAVPKEHLLSVRVLGQRYTGYLTINTENLELPRLCEGFRVQVTLDPTDRPTEEHTLLRITQLQVLEAPPGITDLTEQHLEGFVVHTEIGEEGREIALLVGDKTYRVLPDNNPLHSPGDRISVSYYPGPYPDRLEFVTEFIRLERVKDMDWGIQLEVLDVTRYQCKLRIRKNNDFPFPLTVDGKIGIHLPIPNEAPHSLFCLPPEAATVEERYLLSGDDIFIVDFENGLFTSLQWSGTYKLEKTVYYGNTSKTYTVDFTISLPDVDLGEGKPWIG